MVELLLWPLLAGLVLTSIHAYFGLHVLARGVIFVDLSLAQVAALGLTVAPSISVAPTRLPLRDRKFAGSALERNGFERSVPR